MALDDERQLEAVKLSVAFLQHIMTLSGAAVVLTLALLKRGDTDAPLGVSGFFFGVATVVALVGLIVMLFEVHVDRVSTSTATLFVATAGGFSALLWAI